MSLEDPKEKEYFPLDTDEFALSAAEPTRKQSDWEKITSNMPSVYSEGIENPLDANTDETSNYEDLLDF
ncbi:hypothetical protein KC669_04260 [Candidatus Dojkabacteria bacterium]|uniref:Uncharacterized protein n=1 Tax=Candidatus Dojkabacteria bacterium TaxID=2099670 RepID=A0A955RLL9_9BACT|nr:hypothetical protein [Candidatus Dojkabacteria bacterium]